MEATIDKIFEYYDKNFFEEKVEIDDFGSMGMHYLGLNFDSYLDNSVLSIDYLTLEDYFQATANIDIVENLSLFQQFSNTTLDIKVKVISAILTLINHSTYKSDQTPTIIGKSLNFLKRLGLEIAEDDKTITIMTEYILFSGSYCDIYAFNSQYYRKKLRSQYQRDENWIKRFKYEFDNMVKLVDYPNILKVFNYDSSENSYLMEICDYDLDDYLKENPFINDDEKLRLIKEIISAMIIVHNNGIIHRDLHLGNILMKNNQVILSDFGLSKDTMLIHSLTTTATPKNNHRFMDPIGLADFTKLDKLSDIYAVGKIIEYIIQGCMLESKLSYVIDKAINRDKKRRYQNLEEMLVDIETLFYDIDLKEKNTQIENDILHGKYTLNVEKHLLDLTETDKLSEYIVEKQLQHFWKLLLQFDETNQGLLLKNISKTYSLATGYGRFENYDLFAVIMYQYINNCNIIKLQRDAYQILEGCSNYRYNARDLFDKINLKYPLLLHHL